MKRCNRCGETKPLDAFYVSPRNKGGYSTRCAACIGREHQERILRRRAARDVADTPTEKWCCTCGATQPITEFSKQSVQVDGYSIHCKNCDKVRYETKGRAYAAQRYQDNKEVMQAQRREWKRNNREHKRAYDKEYRARMTEQRNEYNREWYARNNEHARQRAKRYLNHKRTYRYRRHSLLQQNGGSHTWQEWVNLCARYDYRCLRCGEQYPIEGLSADHVIPVTKGGANDISNLQPLCKVCNSRKATKAIDYRPVVAAVWPLLRLLE